MIRFMRLARNIPDVAGAPDLDVHEIVRRKRQHMEIATSESAQGTADPGWNDVHLIPSSVPEVSLTDLDLETFFLGHRLRAPLVISSMTGGHQAALEINRALAGAAEELGMAIGVGSQRAALVDPSLEPTYAVVRETAPGALVVANLGVCQLVGQGSTPALTAEQVERAVEMIGAQVLAIHLNVVEELIQTEGDRHTSGLAGALAELVERVSVPVLAKETGAGMSRETAALLVEAGVAALDVGGAGGTSFARVEAIRAAERGDGRGVRLGETFAAWGVPTAASILEARDLGVPLVATGGIRSGLQAAKALALGANLVGLGRPALVAALEGSDRLREELELFLEELRVAMVLTGSRSVGDLPRSQPVLTGFTRAWLDQRGNR